MQVVENWSRIHGRVEGWEPARKAGGAGTLTLLVERVEDVAARDGSQHRNLLTDAAGTTVRVMVPASVSKAVHPRKGSNAVVDVRRGNSPNHVFAHPDRITLTHE